MGRNHQAEQDIHDDVEELSESVEQHDGAQRCDGNIAPSSVRNGCVGIDGFKLRQAGHRRLDPQVEAELFDEFEEWRSRQCHALT
jgi:hypothetical protein